jgi:hypothetical protein
MRKQQKKLKRKAQKNKFCERGSAPIVNLLKNITRQRERALFSAVCFKQEECV